MKKLLSSLLILSAFIVTILLLPGCIKDTCTRTYRIYTPVYRTTAEVRANIKSNAPRPIRQAGKLFLRGQYIFLNEIDKGIHVIDNSNPANPKNAAFIDIPGNMDLAVKGDILYADLYSDFVTLDISDPLNVTTKKIIDNAFPYRRYNNGFVADNRKIIVDWISRDTTVQNDCDGDRLKQYCATCSVVASDRASFTAESKAASPAGVGGSMARFALANTHLYTVSENDMSVYSIASAANPVFTKKVNMGWGIETIFPFKDKLFIGSTNGMFIYDITTPQAPVRLGQFMHVTSCDPVIADDNNAFVTLRNGNVRCANSANQLDVLDIRNLAAPSLIKSYNMTNPHGLSKDGNNLFICDGRDGLKVYDVSNIKDLKLITHIKGFESYDVIAINKIAILVSKDGIRQYDYSDVNNIRLLSKMVWEQ